MDPDEVLSGKDALDLIDKAVSKWVGLVILAAADASGGKLYEAACALKSLLQDRAYLLVAERVDIAAAAAASGVLLSDQGITLSRKFMKLRNLISIRVSCNTDNRIIPKL